MMLFQEALHASLKASGVLGKVRAQLRYAAVETLRGQGNAAKAAAAGAGELLGAHQIDATEPAQALAHALVLDFLVSQPTLRLSHGIFEEEAGVDRLDPAIQTKDGLASAIGVRAGREPLLVTLLRHGAAAPVASGSVSMAAAVVPLDANGGVPPLAELVTSGPSFTVAAAARWGGTLHSGGRGPKGDTASLDCSDASAGTESQKGVDADWDDVTVLKPAAAAVRGGSDEGALGHEDHDAEAEEYEDDF